MISNNSIISNIISIKNAVIEKNKKAFSTAKRGIPKYAVLGTAAILTQQQNRKIYCLMSKTKLHKTIILMGGEKEATYNQ